MTRPAAQPGVPAPPSDAPFGLLAGYHRALPGLAGLLRDAGLSVGPDRWQNLYDLLAALAAQGRLPSEAAALGPLIAPLVCRSGQEQQAFPALFARWCDGLAPELRGPGPAAPAPAAAGSGPGTGAAVPAPRLRWWLLGLLLLFAALLGAAYWAQRPGPPTAVPVPPVVVPDAPAPVAPPPPLQPPTPPVAPPEPPAAPALQSLPPRRPLPPRVLDPDHRAWHAWLRSFCLLLPPFVALAWLLLRWLTWRTVLERRRGDPQDPLTAIRLPVAADDLLQAPALREALRHLHQPVSVATRRLDVDATVARTARHAGLFRPVTRPRRFVPDLVVLVQARHPGDQMAGLAGQLVARLGEAGLRVQRYDYRDSPRTARGADGRWYAIADLLARHAGARLLLIGEPAALLDPLSGRPLDWTAALTAAPHRALLATRRPPAAWERALTDAGFALAEISSRGLETLAWHLIGLGGPAGSAALPATSRSLPRLLQDARRWSQPVPPPPAERAALLHALDDFLGPDGAWLLAVMAAYPQLHWGLTRVLDLHLFPPDGAPGGGGGGAGSEGGAGRGPAGGAWTDREDRLLRIARLPWCRLGWLPDWLRAALLGRLGRGEQRAVRRVYRALLQRATTAPAGPGEVAIALPVSLPRSVGLLAGLWDWVRERGWRLDRWLHGLRTLSDGRGVLDDAIFADCLFGWRPRPLDFIAPRPLLRRHLGGALGQALAPRLLLALVLGAGGAWLAGLAWQGWLAGRAESRLMDRQHGVHQGYRVEVQCREATAALAEDLRATLADDGFVVRVAAPHPAALALAGPRPVPVNPINRVQWDDAADALLAAHIAERLARLAAGEPPRVTRAHGLRPVRASGVRLLWVVLETDGRVVSPPEPADPVPPEETEPVTDPAPLAGPDQGAGTPAEPDAGQRLLAEIRDLETEIKRLEAELQLELAGGNGRRAGYGPAARALEARIAAARARLADLNSERWPLLSEAAREAALGVDRAALLAQAKANQTDKALATLDLLRGRLGAADPFVTGEAPDAIAQAYVRLAGQAAARGANEQALKLLDQALALDPAAAVGAPRARVERALVYAQLSARIGAADAAGLAALARELGVLKITAAADYPGWEKAWAKTLAVRVKAERDPAAAERLLAAARELLPGAAGLAQVQIRPVAPPPVAPPPAPPPVPDGRNVFRDRLSSGGEGPAMVRLPGGDFLMGSPADEPERDDDETQHRVAIKPFAIGRTEVSFAEYDRFAAATGRATPDDQGWGRGDRPVINVTWVDAIDYAVWLSGETGRRYRLPTEAEWEYAARAGTGTAFWSGGCIDTDQANYDGTIKYPGCKAKTGVDRGQTVPVASLVPNPWGLYEVAGNVWEWTFSEYEAPYEGKEQVGIGINAEISGPLRVIRGGSWYDRPSALRAGNRNRWPPSNRSDTLGFRLAQDL